MSADLAEVRKLDVESQTLALAVTVLHDRLGRLRKEDTDDVFELFRSLREAGTDEERADIVDTILEIMEQAPLTVERLPSGDSAEARPEGLQGWIDFASRKVREARKKAKLTQEELAEKSGLQQSHISRIENGKHSPSPYTLEKIATGLGIPVRDFDPSH